MNEKLLAEIEKYIKSHFYDIETEKKSKRKYSIRLTSPLPDEENKSKKNISFSNKLKKIFDDLLSRIDSSFSTKLKRIIKQKGLTDTEVYKKANMDRRLFSKIRNDKNYQPSKNTVIALAIALELDENESVDLMNYAGYGFSMGLKFDVIILYFIENKIYDIYLINEALEYYELPILGERAKS